MKINILITDDEQIVIDSLSFIINKNFDDVNVFTALSGTEAIEITMKENIDIIFMDINMPRLSGLETASCITKLKPNIIIIILSAFDQFQYAQEAINLGAHKYITKPVNRNVVIETIHDAMEKVNKNRGLIYADAELQKKIDLVSPMVENDFIYACIYNDTKSADLSSYLEYFDLTENSWVFCCFEFPNVNSENQQQIYKKVYDLINLKHRCLISSFMMNIITVYYPIYSQNVNSNILKEEINQIYLNLLYNISNGIRCGVSSIENKIQKLQTSYNDARSALTKTLETGGIYFLENLENKNEQNDFKAENSQQFYDIKNQIIQKLKMGDNSGVQNFFELFSTQLISSNFQIERIKNLFFDLVVTANNSAKEINSQYFNCDFENAFSIFTKKNDFSMLKDFVEKILNDCSLAIKNVRNSVENPIIKKVCNYVDNHLEDDISLEQMASIVGVSSFYLSKLFKEEKGITFITFISDKRLEKSCQLLNESELSIKEITAKVGYNDQNYFSKIFKNKYGVSPKEYRKIQ